MQTNIEQVTNLIRNLPLEDFNKLREAVDSVENAIREKDENLKKQFEDYAKAKKWISENGEKYINQWVCLEGDKLIAHGTDGRKVFQQAKDAGIEIPFIKRIVEEPKAFMGGWL